MKSGVTEKYKFYISIIDPLWQHVHGKSVPLINVSPVVLYREYFALSWTVFILFFPTVYRSDKRTNLRHILTSLHGIFIIFITQNINDCICCCFDQIFFSSLDPVGLCEGCSSHHVFLGDLPEF